MFWLFAEILSTSTHSTLPGSPSKIELNICRHMIKKRITQGHLGSQHVLKQGEIEPSIHKALLQHYQKQFWNLSGIGVRFAALWLILIAGGTTLLAQTGNAPIVEDLEGNLLKYNQLRSSTYTVLVFLSPECPLCENYSVTLQQLRTKFTAQQVNFVGVFSGKWFSESDIRSYLSHYQPPVQPILDKDYQFMQLFGAKVTPEVFVVDQEGSLHYQGKIDNWIVSLGKKRTVVNEFYLHDALRALLRGEEPAIRQTEAIGCFIE